MNAPMVHSPVPTKSIGIAYLLWFFFGGVGAHKFYLRRPGLGCLYIGLLFLWWFGVFGVAGNAVATAMGHGPSGGLGMMSVVLIAPLSFALLYDLVTIPMQVRAANGGPVSGLLGFGSKSARAFDDKDGLDGARLAKFDEAIARYKAEQTAPAATTPRAPVAARATAAAGGTPTFGKRR